MRLAFDGVEFDTETGEVRREGRTSRLEPQPAALLTLLASRPGELVTQRELIAAVWGGGTHVEFGAALHYSIRQIRLALGDVARQPRFVETIPRRGYRFIAAAGRPVPAAPSHRLRRHALIAAAVVALSALTIAVERRPNRHHETAIAIVSAVHDWIF